MLECPRCASNEIRRSQFQSADLLLVPILLAPFRCCDCGTRFYEFFWKAAGLASGGVLKQVETTVRDVYQTQRARANALMEPPAPPNRRVWVRHLVEWEGSMHASSQAVDRPFPARIKDVSRGGLRLVAYEAFKEGALVSIEVSELGRVFLAAVVHSQVLPDGSYSIGCRFTKDISEAELAGFVRHR
jgi:hypothetical protein